MLIASFLIDDKVKKLRLFEKIFLLTNISMNIALGIPFFTLKNAKINFLKRELN